MSEPIKSITDVQERVEGNRFAMVTSIDERGTLSSRPVTVQRFDDGGDLWFLVDRDADWVGPLDGGPVNAAIADERTWVSFAGRASLVHDSSKIEELCDSMSETFFEEGAEPVALHVVTDRIEWWASPNKAVQIVELAKATLTDSEPDMGSSGAIEV